MTEEQQLAAESTEKKKNPLAQIIIWVAVGLLLTIVAIQLVKSQQGAIQVGQTAPDFVLTTFEGTQIDTAELRGKVVLVNFWASWCNPCELEAADLQAAWEYYEPRGDVIFLGVDWTDTDNEALAYLKKFAITYPNGPDLGTRISQAYRTTGVPETYVIDQEGTLVYAKFGPFDSLSEIMAVIDPLLVP